MKGRFLFRAVLQMIHQIIMVFKKINASQLKIHNLGWFIVQVMSQSLHAMSLRSKIHHIKHSTLREQQTFRTSSKLLLWLISPHFLHSYFEIPMSDQETSI